MYQEILEKCIMVSTNIWLFSTFIINIFNNGVPIITDDNWAANQYIRMISEGSCDTEDWSNDAENSALITGINYSLKYIQIESSYVKL